MFRADGIPFSAMEIVLESSSVWLPRQEMECNCFQMPWSFYRTLYDLFSF